VIGTTPTTELVGEMLAARCGPPVQEG